LRHTYALGVVVAGWVLFRAESFGQALTFLANMAGLAKAGPDGQKIARYWSHELAWVLLLGAVFALPTWRWLEQGAAAFQSRVPAVLRPATLGAGLGLQLTLVIALLLISVSWLAGGTYNPFIYFRF
jgi:alginate O-acetyltransferase complex protein AlgI